jgi:nucleotide-binding universal stress UspA family protein
MVAFDGSERGLDALLLGESLTVSEGELLLCCVHHYQALSARIDPTEPSIDRETAEEYVGNAMQFLKRGLTVTPILVSGANAARTLQKTAIAEHADLIMLGSSHRGVLGRVLIGSVTQETLHGAPCPVAVAPVGFHIHPPEGRLGRVAFGYDVVEPTPSALSVVVALCEETGAELRIVAVAEDAAVADPARAMLPYAAISQARLGAAGELVAEAIAGLPETVSATSDVRDGEPAEQLLDASRDVDLLVLGSHGRGMVGRLAMGSVCDAVVRAARCAVLVLPPGESTTSESVGAAMHSRVDAGS